MSATLSASAGVLHEELAEQVRALPLDQFASATLTAQLPDGVQLKLPADISRFILQILEGVQDNQLVQLVRIPEELTSNAAAEMLGISRPTLLKLAGEGHIASHKVGSHHRFMRADVLAFRKERAARMDAALDDFLQFQVDHPELMESE